MTESPTSAPHFAKVRDYPPFARPSEISITGRWRPILRLNCGWQPGHTHKRQAVFIGANPSAASGVTSDATINKVLRFMCSPDADLLGWPACNELLVVNLSPLRATLAHEAIAALSEPGAIAESMERNQPAMQALRAALSEGVYQPSIFVGWGDCLKHHTPALAAPFVELLRGREVLHLPPVRSGAPGHPCRAPRLSAAVKRSILWPEPTTLAPATPAPCDYVYTEEDIPF